MPSPLRVVSVASNKGGVGKTTLATNLAVYLRALREDLPVLLLGLDDQGLIDRMFALEVAPPKRNALDALRDGDLASAIRLGQYGVHYVPTSPMISELGAELRDPFGLRPLLEASGFGGLVLLDTPGDLGPLTRSALAASDLALVVVADQSSLDQAGRIYALLREWGRPPELARIVLSLVDLRVKYRGAEAGDILALLVSEIRRRGHPLLGSFVSRSPKIESLVTNPHGRALSILHGARGSLIDRQFGHLAHDLLELLEGSGAPAAGRPAERRHCERRPYPRRVPAFRFAAPPVVSLAARDLSCEGMGIEAGPRLEPGERLHVALGHATGSESLLVWARVARGHAGGPMGLRFEGPEPVRQHLAELVAALPRESP